MKNVIYYCVLAVVLLGCSEEEQAEAFMPMNSAEDVIENQDTDQAENQENNTTPEDNSDNTTDDTSQGNENTVVSFSADIQPIINSNCITCHQDPPRFGAPFPLLNFDQVSARANAIFTQVNAGLMPPRGKLSDANIALIQQWINDDKPE